MSLQGFETRTFCHDGEARTVYRRGVGPGVLVMHEVPGIIPQVTDFARRVADAGFTVALPHLFGIPGKPFSARYNLRTLAWSCVVREFSVFAARRASPITDWLRALGRELHAECGGAGIGAVGMCLTGNFALTLFADPSVLAPVLSQPSLPVALGPQLARSLHVKSSDLAEVQRRVREEDGKVLGLRFSADRLCPAARFQALREALGDGFEAIEIDSSPGNPHGISSSAHSVLARHLVDEDGHPTRDALERTLSFLAERLT